MLKNTRDGLPSGWKFPIYPNGAEVFVMAYTYIPIPPEEPPPGVDFGEITENLEKTMRDGARH